jgi:hypothetical protein
MRSHPDWLGGFQHQEIGLLDLPEHSQLGCVISDTPKPLDAMHSSLHDFETVNQKPKLFTLIEFKECLVIGVIEYDSCCEDNRE